MTLCLFIPEEGPWWGTRHTLGLLVFLGLMLSYMVRFNLSIAIVAMVGSKPLNSTKNLTDVCKGPADSEVDDNYTVSHSFIKFSQISDK